jgi:hypothetical protein
MGLRTFLGPLLVGTQKNNNTQVITSNTPSSTFLSSSVPGPYRNTGVSDAIQFVTVPQATFTGIAAASYPATVVPVNTVGGVNYPVIIPAGSYIDNIDFNVTTAFTFSGGPTSLAINVQLVGATGTTYATAQTIAVVTLTAASLPTIGNYALGNSSSTPSATNPIVATATATPLAMLLNTGTSDAMLQINLAWTGGASPAITAGACSFTFAYIVRNPDGSFYPTNLASPFVPPGGYSY